MAPPVEATRPAASVLKGLLLLAALVAAGLLARQAGTGVLAGTPPTLAGAASLVGAGALLTALGVPRQAVAFSGAYAFGAWRGGALALLAQMLGCVLDYGYARLATRRWPLWRQRGRLSRTRDFVVRRPFSATLTLRLLPVGNNVLLNLAAGAAGLRAGPFLAATLLGYVPQTAIFALAGSGVHVDRTSQLILGACLFLASAGLSAVLLRTAMAEPALPGRGPAGTLVP